MRSDVERSNRTLGRSGDVRITVEYDHHEEWDDFVARTPGGDLAQTSAWTRLKRAAGMDAHRIVLRVDGVIEGGAQLLARRIPVVGAVAYLPYGPLIRPDLRVETTELLVNVLENECRRNRIRLLCVQPPERGERVAAALRAARFRPSANEVAPGASLRFDLQFETDEIVSQMSAHRRAEFRRGRRSQVSIRVGTREDLGAFHELLCCSAARKGFEPTPRPYLEAIWDELHSMEQVAVLFASSEGTNISGILVTRFGDVVIERLRGFAADRAPRKLRPNDALTWATIDWSRDQGARWYDVGGIGRLEAAALARGDPDACARMGERPDSYKIAMRGTPVVYPEPLEIVPNPLLRLGYATVRSSALARRLRHVMHTRGRNTTDVGGKP